MSTAENKAVVRRYWEEVVAGANWELADELLAPEMDTHGRFPQQEPGREGLKHVLQRFHAACPDLEVTVDDLVAEGDRVAVRWRAEGSLEADLFGIAPGGQELTLAGIVIYRLEGGRIVEQWASRDDLTWMTQLGGPLPHHGAAAAHPGH